MATGYTLPDILASHNAVQARSEALTSQSQEKADENAKLRADAIDAATLLGNLEFVGAQRQNAIDLEAQASRKAVADAFGADIKNPESQLAYLVREQGEAIREANERAKYASELASMHMGDNPLAYLIQRPFLGEELALSKMAAERAKMLDKAIDDINAQVPAAIQTQNAIQQTFTQEDAARKLELVSLSAADKVRTLRLQQNTAQLQDLAAVQNIAAKDFDMTVTKYNLVQDANKRALEFEELAARRAARKAEQVQLEIYMDWYNAGAKVLGRKPFTDVNQFAAQLKINKDSIAAVAERGGMNVQSGSVNDVIANAPGNAAIMLEQVQGTLPATASRTSNYLKTESNFAKQDIQAAGGKLTAESAAQRANLRMVGGEEEFQDGKNKGKRNVKGSSSTMLSNAEQDLHGGKVQNIYKAPHLGTVLQTLPQLQGMKGLQEVVIPASQHHNGVALGDATMKQAAISVVKGELTIEEARSIVQNYFKAVALTNTVNERYSTVGLPTQSSYRTLVADPITGELVSVDLMNDSARINHYLTKAAYLGKMSKREQAAIDRSILPPGMASK